MNIFNKIKNYFTNINDSSTNINDQDQPTNSITFSISPEMNLEPYVKIRIEDISTPACAKFVQMLNDINAGSYHESIISLMTQMSGEDENIKKFMNKAILYWRSLDRTKKQIPTNTFTTWRDKPLIMPMDFNKNAK